MKTPDEIKKGLECCYGDKEKRLCDSCPNSAKIEGYTELICLDFDSIGEDALAYIQQLERERDAAVEQLKEVDRIDLFSCSHCKNEEFSVCEFVDCENCDKDCPCATCVDMSNWEWIGAQEVE